MKQNRISTDLQTACDDIKYIWRVKKFSFRVNGGIEIICRL